jgi:hypothetical protein
MPSENGWLPYGRTLKIFGGEYERWNRGEVHRAEAVGSPRLNCRIS